MYSSIDMSDHLRKVENRCFVAEVKSTSTTYITGDGQRLIWMPNIKKIRKHNLGVISHVKSRAKNRELDYDDIGSFDFAGVFDIPTHEHIWKGFEIDVVAAYWNEARKRGLCSEEMFQKYLTGKDRKIARNMSIGSLNSKKHIYEFFPYSLGGEENDYKIGVTEKIAPKIYRAICNEIVTMLAEIGANCKKPVFYWVDQIYVQGKINKKLLSNIAKDYGHTLTFKPVTVVRKLGHFSVYLKEKNGLDIRPFCLEQR